MKCDKLYLELKVRVINVNYEKGAELLKHCQTLSDYSRLVYTAKLNYERTGDLDIAVTEAVTECMQKGILSDFLKENGGEVMSFLYDMLTKEEMEEIREHDGYVRGLKDGVREGKELGIKEGEERGLRKGKELGVSENRRAIAANMLAMNMEISTIARVTGLSEDEVRALQ